MSGCILVACLELQPAHLAELVDALVLGTSGFGRGGSSPPVGIRFPNLVPLTAVSQSPLVDDTGPRTTCNARR